MRLITAALRQEISDFKKELVIDEHIALPPCHAYKGRYRDHDVGILLTSVGPLPEVIRFALGEIVRRWAPKEAIIMGFAGGLKSGLESGDLLLLGELIYETSAGVAPERGLPMTRRPGDTDAHLAKITVNQGSLYGRVSAGYFPVTGPRSEHRFHTGVGITVAQACVSRAEKEALAVRTGAIAVDMENFHIAACLRDHGIPFVVVRSVFDPLELELPPPSISGLVDEQGRFQPGKGVELVLRHPRDILKIPDFARRAAKARKALTQFLLHLLD